MSSTYDVDWLVGLDMGPNPLWQLEQLLTGLEIPPGAAVLDLGCGRGATSVYLARELGAQVTACDLWVPADEIQAVVEAAGVGDQVRVVNADARRLPFADGEFAAIVSIDAFEYFGTDVHFLPGLLRHLRPGGALGMTTPGLRLDPYAARPPAHVTDVVGWEVGAWHSPQWWVTHWELTGMLRDVRATMQPHGREDWLAWCDLVGARPTDPVPAMLAADDDGLIGLVQVWAVNG